MQMVSLQMNRAGLDKALQDLIDIVSMRYIHLYAIVVLPPQG